jgi:nucleoside-diphosphate-sugar epimerase
MPIAVVFGATGIVGSGIVQNLLQKGETVVAPVRSKPEKLIELVGKWDGLLVPEVIDSLTSLAIIH